MESIIKTVIILLVTFAIGILGYEISEREHCMKEGGSYSFDFGKCIKKGELYE